MNTRCPKCGQGFSCWMLVAYIRVFSITCPQCKTMLALDYQGRRALFGSIIAAFLLSLALGLFLRFLYIVPVLVISGILVGCIAGAHWGAIGVSPEDPSRQENP